MEYPLLNLIAVRPECRILKYRVLQIYSGQEEVTECQCEGDGAQSVVRHGPIDTSHTAVRLPPDLVSSTAEC